MPSKKKKGQKSQVNSSNYFGRPKRNDGKTHFLIETTPKRKEIYAQLASESQFPIIIDIKNEEGITTPSGNTKRKEAYKIGDVIATRPIDEESPIKETNIQLPSMVKIDFIPADQLPNNEIYPIPNIPDSEHPSDFEFSLDPKPPMESLETSSDEASDDPFSFLESLQKTKTFHQKMRINRANIQNVYRAKRRNNGNRVGGAQKDKFGGVSADNAAEKIDLNRNIKREYLHGIAYFILGEKGQRKKNLFLGSKECNTQMMFAENIVRKIIMTYGYDVELDVTVTVDASTPEREYYQLATEIIYKINIIGLGEITLTFDPQSNVRPDFSLEKALWLRICTEVARQKEDNKNKQLADSPSPKNHQPQSPTIPHFKKNKINSMEDKEKNGDTPSHQDIKNSQQDRRPITVFPPRKKKIRELPSSPFKPFSSKANSAKQKSTKKEIQEKKKPTSSSNKNKNDTTTASQKLQKTVKEENKKPTHFYSLRDRKNNTSGVSNPESKKTSVVTAVNKTKPCNAKVNLSSKGSSKTIFFVPQQDALDTSAQIAADLENNAYVPRACKAF